MAAVVEDESGVASVEYAADGESFVPIDFRGRYFVHRADLAANPAAAYRVTDRAGNRTVARPSVSVGARPPRPEVADALSVAALPGEASIELAGTVGKRPAKLSLPAPAQADFDALGDINTPPERYATRLLVTGALSLKGQASAEGLVKAVSFSADGGASWTPLASAKDEKSAKAILPFSLAMDAQKLAEGPARWAIRIEDFAGSTFACPIYAMVDTKGPAFSVLYPDAGASSMPGPFPLVLKLEDALPIESADLAIGATANSGKEPLDLGAGGRYFARMVEAGPASAKAPALATATAKDSGGNQGSLSRKFGYDAAADAPRISLVLPAGAVEAGAVLCGSAADDDGAVGAKLSIDGKEELSFPSGAFALALPELPVGKHSMSIVAGDQDSGMATLKKDLLVKGRAPSIRDLAVKGSKGSEPLAAGGAYELGTGLSLAGLVDASNGLASVTVSINGSAPTQAAVSKSPSGALGFSYPFPAGLRFDRASIEVVARDSIGLSASKRVELHNALPSAAGTDVGEALKLFDERVADSGDGASSFLLSPGDELAGRFNGRPIAAVSIEPATEVLSAAYDGSRVFVEAVKDGLVGASRLELRTVDGDLFSWGPFTAAVDSGGPALEVSAPSDGDWVRGEVRVAGSAADPDGIASLSVSVDGGEPTPLTAKAGVGGVPGGAGLAFDAPLQLGTVADGAHRIELSARDGAGRETRVSRYILKDTVAPALAQVEPSPGESVNGLTTFVVEARDDGRLASALFRASARGEPEEVSGLGTFSRDLDLVRLTLPLAEGGGFAATDKAGNEAILVPDVVVDAEKDKPIVEIDTPEEAEVMRGDFSIDGVAYDDDGLAAAYYRLDSGAWMRLEMEGTSFSIPIALKDIADNEHLVEVKAEDIYGVQGDLASLRFRVSKEEPSASMTAPPISKPVRGLVELRGAAADANGIAEVAVSVDNRATFDAPIGTTDWKIRLDTSTLSDGIHAVAVRPIDGYGTEGFYASMVYVDNTPPGASIDLPRDGDEVAGSLAVSGRIADGVALASSRIEIAPVGSASPPVLSIDLGVDKIVHRAVDISALKPGAYSVRLVVADRADNTALASRDVIVTGPAPVDSVSIVFPVEGQGASGKLRIQGQARIAAGAGAVKLYADGAELGEAKPDELGWYSLELPPLSIADGPHAIKARASSADGSSSVESPETRIQWSARGPWVSVESLASGAYLAYRPFLKGKAGWAADPPPQGSSKEERAALEAYNKEAKAREVSLVEVSLDDGRSFARAKGGSSWSFRLETQDYREGALRVIVRARYAGGETSVVKGMYFLDKTPPRVEVIGPTEGGRYNGSLAIAGWAADENGLGSIDVALRKGDKANYEVPSFIQGLYVDGQALGASLWQAGLGLTFFSDNVKLEGFYGQAPEASSSGEAESFFGDVFGAKLIANLFYLPFSSIFGQDLDFLSAAFGVGANFTYFTQTQADTGLVVSSVFAQLEFPKLTAKSWRAFKKFSLYTEFQMWVLSSVVEGGFIPKMSFGGRVGVF